MTRPSATYCPETDDHQHRFRPVSQRMMGGGELRTCNWCEWKQVDSPHGDCDCGSQLSHFAGPNAGGVLCPDCDSEHVAELRELNEREQPPTPLQLLEDAVRRQGEAIDRLQAALMRRPTEAQLRRVADVLDKLASDELRAQLIAPYDVAEWQEHVEGSRAVAEWLRSMALAT